MINNITLIKYLKKYHSLKESNIIYLPERLMIANKIQEAKDYHSIVVGFGNYDKIQLFDHESISLVVIVTFSFIRFINISIGFIDIS